MRVEEPGPQPCYPECGEGGRGLHPRSAAGGSPTACRLWLRFPGDAEDGRGSSSGPLGVAPRGWPSRAPGCCRPQEETGGSQECAGRKGGLRLLKGKRRERKMQEKERGKRKEGGKEKEQRGREEKRTNLGETRVPQGPPLCHPAHLVPHPRLSPRSPVTGNLGGGVRLSFPHVRPHSCPLDALGASSGGPDPAPHPEGPVPSIAGRGSRLPAPRPQCVGTGRPQVGQKEPPKMPASDAVGSPPELHRLGSRDSCPHPPTPAPAPTPVPTPAPTPWFF